MLEIISAFDGVQNLIRTLLKMGNGTRLNILCVRQKGNPRGTYKSGKADGDVDF